MSSLHPSLNNSLVFPNIMNKHVQNYNFDKTEEAEREDPGNRKKSHKCNQCHYASSNSGHLEEHLKVHSGEKLNKCGQCDYAYSQACTLKRHLKTHSGEKSNKCNQCDYASSEAGNLRRHLKTHCG